MLAKNLSTDRGSGRARAEGACLEELDKNLSQHQAKRDEIHVPCTFPPVYLMHSDQIFFLLIQPHIVVSRCTQDLIEINEDGAFDGVETAARQTLRECEVS